jgi:hypothetical protein
MARKREVDFEGVELTDDNGEPNTTEKAPSLEDRLSVVEYYCGLRSVHPAVAAETPPAPQDKAAAPPPAPALTQLERDKKRLEAPQETPTPE